MPAVEAYLHYKTVALDNGRQGGRAALPSWISNRGEDRYEEREMTNASYDRLMPCIHSYSVT